MAKDVPKGKWSLHYDFCQNCYTNQIPYKADGLCQRCYMWFYKQAQKLGFATKRVRGMIVRGKRTGGKRTKETRRGEPREARKGRK